ncbi:MAG: hypothetical protein AAB694_00320, partial [Patescibacteria group bacterium]
AGNWLRAQLSRRGVLEAFGLAVVAAACAPKTSSLSPTPEATPTPTSTPEPTLTREAELAPKEPTPEEKIHTFLKEVLKPEVYHPAGPPKLLYRGKSVEAGQLMYDYEWNMGEWKGIQLRVRGTYYESIKGEKFAEDGLPLRISISIPQTQKNVRRLIPSEIGQVIGEYYTLPSTITASSWEKRRTATPSDALETLWDNPDGTKEGRVAIIVSGVSSDGYGNYYLGATKIFKDFPGYNKGTSLTLSSQ